MESCYHNLSFTPLVERAIHRGTLRHLMGNELVEAAAALPGRTLGRRSSLDGTRHFQANFQAVLGNQP